MVRIIGLDIISNDAPLGGGTAPSDKQRLDGVLANAELFERLGLDGFAVGERHHDPFVSSAPPVILASIAARTDTIKLFTGVTLLSVLDPVRVAEDYATLDLLSDGRLELIVGKGNGPEQSELFGIRREDAWDTQRDNYRLLRDLWSGKPVNWDPPTDRPAVRHSALRDARVYPAPLQERIRTWHGSSTSEATVELAAEYGDPIWVANVQKSVEGYAPLVRHYRKTWAEAGRDPQDALVGTGFISLFVRENSQEAIEAFRPIYEARFAGKVDSFNNFADDQLFHSFDDFVKRSSALIGSPEQVIDKLGRYHEAYGFKAISIPSTEADWPRAQWVESLELFQSAVRPQLDAIAAGPADW